MFEWLPSFYAWTLSSFPPPKVKPFDPRHASPRRFSGKEARNFGLDSCPFFHLCQCSVKSKADLPWPSLKRGCGMWPSLLLLVVDALPFSFLLDPERHCPSELLGTEVWQLLWPQLSNTEHPSINGKQQDLSALPFRRGSLRATFSTAICSLSPLWTMSLFFKPSLSSPLPPPFLHS